MASGRDMRRLKTLTELQAQLHKTTDAFTLLQNEDILDAFSTNVTFDLGSRNRCPIIHLHHNKNDVDVTYDIEKDKYIVFLYTDSKAFYCEQSSQYDVVYVLRLLEQWIEGKTLQGKWVRIRNTKNYPA